MGGRRRSSSSRGRRRNVLALLKPEEDGSVLRALLDRHPELVAEAEEIATAMMAEADAAALADRVERAVLDLDIDDLGSRAGRRRRGYVKPTEAAGDLLEEAVNPFMDELERQVELGLEAAATATCAGIVLGLYRCRGRNPDEVLGWAEDFPAEAAAHAVEVMAQESAANHDLAWRLRDPIVEQVPDWAEMIARAAKPAR